MSKAEQQLAEARDARDGAKTRFDTQLAQLRGEPEHQTMSERIAERVKDDAAAALHQALDIASESKGIIAGTVVALALWFLRHPIIAWAEQMFGGEAEESDNND